MSTANDKSLAVGHPCPKCGSTNVTRSQRRGIQEAVVLKREGLSPYRCRECDARFIQPSLHRQSRTHSWASSLGIPEGKQRRRFTRLVVTAVLVVIALVIAWMLFGYLTRPSPPADAAGLAPAGDLVPRSGHEGVEPAPGPPPSPAYPHFVVFSHYGRRGYSPCRIVLERRPEGTGHPA